MPIRCQGILQQMGAGDASGEKHGRILRAKFQQRADRRLRYVKDEAGKILRSLSLCQQGVESVFKAGQVDAALFLGIRIL